MFVAKGTEGVIVYDLNQYDDKGNYKRIGNLLGLYNDDSNYYNYTQLQISDNFLFAMDNYHGI